MRRDIRLPDRGESASGDRAETRKALGIAHTELLYAAAELRSAASRGDIDSRALLYNLADSLESAAGRLKEPQREAALPTPVPHSSD